MGSLLNILAAGTTPKTTGVEDLSPVQKRLQQQELSNKQTEAALIMGRTASIGLENQEKQQHLGDMNAFRGSMQRNGGNTGKALQDQDFRTSVSPDTLMSLDKSYTENEKGIADAAKLRADADEAQQKLQRAHEGVFDSAMGSMQKSGWNPAVTDALLGHIEQSDPSLGPMLAPIRQKLAQAPTTAQGVQSVLEPLYNQRQAQKDEAAKQELALKAAQSAHAASETARQTQDQLTHDVQAAAPQLSMIARDRPEQLQSALDQLPHGVAKRFEGVTTPEDILHVGMTPEQITTSGHAATVATEAGRHNLEAEGQAKRRNAIAQGDLDLKHQQAGFEQGGGVSLAAKAIADGTLDPQTVRSMVRRNPGIITQIKQVDPDFDEANIDKRYNTLKEFTSTSIGKAGGQVIALNTLIRHADLYLDVADSLKNGSFVPGNAVYNKVAQLFGSDPPTNAALVGRFLASEASRVATGGVPAEGEIKAIFGSLNTSGSPDQIKGAATSLIGIASGRAIPFQERVNDAKLSKIIQVLSPDAKQILAKRGYDPETMKPIGAGTSKTHKVGDTVRIGGKSVKITAIHSDGTFDGDEVK